MNQDKEPEYVHFLQYSTVLVNLQGGEVPPAREMGKSARKRWFDRMAACCERRLTRARAGSGRGNVDPDRLMIVQYQVSAKWNGFVFQKIDGISCDTATLKMKRRHRLLLFRKIIYDQ
jgi:hypothetical protein